MTTWMRAQSLPRFFVVSVVLAFAAGLMGIVVSVLAFHDHVMKSLIVRMCVYMPLTAIAVTLGERSRRRRATAS